MPVTVFYLHLLSFICSFLTVSDDSSPSRKIKWCSAQKGNICIQDGVFPGGSDGKEYACNEGDLGSIIGLGRSPGGGRGKPTPGFLSGESMWTEKPSTGSQRVRCDWATKDSTAQTQKICCKLNLDFLLARMIKRRIMILTQGLVPNIL